MAGASLDAGDGIVAMVPQPSTSVPNKDHRIYLPCLLRDRVIKEVDVVWCADITYIPMARGQAYLVAIMDLHSRAVLSWDLSNTMGSSFCVRAVAKAIQSTGRWMDNVFIERLGRSLKHEKIRLWSYTTVSELRLTSTTGWRSTTIGVSTSPLTMRRLGRSTNPQPPEQHDLKRGGQRPLLERLH